MDFAAMETFLKNDLIDALTSLKEDKKPAWGNMSAQHMVEHLGGLMVLSTKQNNLGNHIDEATKNKKAVWFFEEKGDFPKNMLMVGQDGPTLFPLRFKDLEEAKNGFLKSMTRFFSTYSQDPGLQINHPLFGVLNYQQWVYFHYKHTRHHLEQFGLD